MDEDSRATIEWLRALPAGARVGWASDHVTRERPWGSGWIDVRVPDGGPGGMAWVWTILHPDDPDQPLPGQLWQFRWPPDADESRGWSPAAVSDALADWATRHAGRPDLHFEWDSGHGPSPTLQRVAERAAQQGPVWDLGDGLEVSDGALDDLLALDPDEAAEIVAVLRAAAADFRGNGRP